MAVFKNLSLGETPNTLYFLTKKDSFNLRLWKTLRGATMKAKRKRAIPQLFFISENEEILIEEKMKEAGIKNKSAYLRKMALDGYIIKQDFTVVKDVIYQLNHIGNNLNQLTKIANTYGDVYLSEIKSIKKDIERIWQLLSSKV
jgi:hypothetical protein